MYGRRLLCSLLIGCQPLLAQAQDKKVVPPGSNVNIIVKPAEPEKPPITLKLNGRQAKALPQRCGFTHTAGGNIEVQQPSPDTFLINVTGVAVAGGHPCKASSASIQINLSQCFEVVFEKTDVKYPKLTLEGRVIGLLRSRCLGGGSASESAQAAIAPAHGGEALTMSLPSNLACKGQNLSINDHEGPICAPVLPGKYVLHAQFDISAKHPLGLCKAASAEFAPDALDPLWISHDEPFRGIAKKDFGFQIVVKVMDEPPPGVESGNGTENGDKKGNGEKKGTAEKLDAPRP
jgi:hypothetical protein